MRKRAVVIYTLLALATSNLTHKAVAVEPAVSSNSGSAASSVKDPQGAWVPVVPPPPSLLRMPEVPPETISGVSVGTKQDDLVLTATNVQVVGASQELQQIITNVIKTRAGGGTSQSQLQNDIASILRTGLFASAKVNSNPNRQGLDVVYQVEPVMLRSVELQGAKALTLPVVTELIKGQLNTAISPAGLNQVGDKINKWYADNGYDLAQVVSLQPKPNGTLTVEVAEGVVGEIKIRFFDRDGKLTSDNGDPVKGRTREDFIKNQLKLKPGDVFRREQASQDLGSLYRTGLFENATISLDGDARKVNLTYNLTEAPSRSVNAGAGYNAATGIVGTVNYQDNNLNGVNQKLGLNLQGNTRDLQFDGKFADPYRANEPNRWGYTVNVFRNRVLSLTFDDTVKLPNGDRTREGQFGGGVSLSRPVGDWQASVGVNYQRTSIRDGDGNLVAVDEKGNPLSYSGTGIDDLTTVSASLTRDQRDNPFNPTSGSVVSVSTKQSVPVGQGNILMNQLEASYTQYVPLGFMSKKDQTDVLAFNVQGGTTIGDLPPYEAFNLGGPNSVRGYGTGQVASGRSYVLASAEYRVPIWKPVTGVLFADFGSDLGSAATVPGEPGVVRDKPGFGFGYGAGVRFNTPLGIIRADYGFNDQGESRLQLGVGQRF